MNEEHPGCKKRRARQEPDVASVSQRESVAQEEKPHRRRQERRRAAPLREELRVSRKEKRAGGSESRWPPRNAERPQQGVQREGHRGGRKTQDEERRAVRRRAREQGDERRHRVKTGCDLPETRDRKERFLRSRKAVAENDRFGKRRVSSHVPARKTDMARGKGKSQEKNRQNEERSGNHSPGLPPPGRPSCREHPAAENERCQRRGENHERRQPETDGRDLQGPECRGPERSRGREGDRGNLDRLAPAPLHPGARTPPPAAPAREM